MTKDEENIMMLEARITRTQLELTDLRGQLELILFGLAKMKERVDFLLPATKFKT